MLECGEAERGLLEASFGDEVSSEVFISVEKMKHVILI